ncbi:MAG: hypothetical protein PF505_01520, partial [Vallitaleaceae bacterium]|nr:hypothetical protein [Vallitaleaceae bacterium]
MKNYVKVLLIVIISGIFQLSIFSSVIVVEDKVGANMLIPIEATNVVVSDAQINYSIDKPKSVKKDETNVDEYKGKAVIDAEYELTNVGEETTHVILALPVNALDDILEISIEIEIYEAVDIEVDRLTSIHTDGLALNGEYNVTKEQIISRILSSKNDGVSNYITGIWERVYIVEFDIEAGETTHFNLTYEEVSGASRRGNNAVSSVMWEPEFYYYFEYMKYFGDVESMTITLHLPNSFIIENSSYESYDILAPDVYQIMIEGLPEYNLIFTVHNPANAPVDTGVVGMMGLVVKLLIVSGAIIGVLILFVLFNIFILPIVKKNLENKKIEKFKSRITAEDDSEPIPSESITDLDGEYEEESKDMDQDVEGHSTDALESVDDIILDEADDTQTAESENEEDNVKGVASSAIEVMDEHLENARKLDSQNKKTDVDIVDTIKSTEKAPLQVKIAQFFAGIVSRLKSPKRLKPILTEKSLDHSLRNALDEDLNDIINYKDDSKVSPPVEEKQEDTETIDAIEDIVDAGDEEDLEDLDDAKEEDVKEEDVKDEEALSVDTVEKTEEAEAEVKAALEVEEDAEPEIEAEPEAEIEVEAEPEAEEEPEETAEAEETETEEEAVAEAT